jgi:hypothetical protein
MGKYEMIKKLTVDSVGFDKLLKQNNPFQKGDCRFDLSDVGFITPIGLVSLAAASYALDCEGKQPVIFLGNNFDLYTYLSRAGFITVVRPVARIESPFLDSISLGYEDKRGLTESLIELTRLTSSTELFNLLDSLVSERIISVLRRRLGYQKYDSYDVATAISEVCQNTFEHNSETYSFIAMQVYGDNKFLEIGVADYGDGIAKSLKRNSSYSAILSDVEAINLATKPRVSEYEDPTRGTGLYHLLEIAYKHNGTVQVRSGSGAARYRMDRREALGISVPWMPGVQISLMLGRKST